MSELSILGYYLSKGGPQYFVYWIKYERVVAKAKSNEKIPERKIPRIIGHSTIDHGTDREIRKTFL